MDVHASLSLGSRLILYAILAAIAIVTVLVFRAQLGCIRGRPFENPDGTRDD